MFNLNVKYSLDFYRNEVLVVFKTVQWPYLVQQVFFHGPEDRAFADMFRTKFALLG